MPMTDKDKVRRGGKIARIFGLKLDERSLKFVVVDPETGKKTLMSAEGVYDTMQAILRNGEGK